MGVVDRIKGVFRRKKTELPPLPEEPFPAPKMEGVELGEVTMENVKAKMELVMTRLDSINTQYSALSERIKNIERLVIEIRSFCK